MIALKHSRRLFLIDHDQHMDQVGWRTFGERPSDLSKWAVPPSNADIAKNTMSVQKRGRPESS